MPRKSTDDPPKQRPAPKSSLQLKRERICRNLAKNEERVRIFREKLFSQTIIYDASQNQNVATPHPPTTDDL